MHIVEHEDILLCIQVIILIPLCRWSRHHSHTMLFCKGMVEQEIVIPQVSEWFIIALVTWSFFRRNRLPVIFRREVIDEPEFGIVTESALEFQPFGKSQFRRQVGKEVITFRLALVQLRRPYRVADATVPFRITFRPTPWAVFILHRKNGKSFQCITDIIAARILRISAESDIIGELQPLQHLCIAVGLKRKTAIVYTAHRTRLIEKTTGYIIMRLLISSGITYRIVLHHTRA